MIPFIVLVLTFVLCRALGLALPYLGKWQHCLRVALAVMFLLTASAHWGRRRDDLIRMVPRSLSRPGLWVTVTGVAEIAGGLGLLWPPVQHAAAIGLLLLLVAVFPANVRAAREKLTIGGREVPGLMVRTAMQVIFVGAVIAAGWF